MKIKQYERTTLLYSGIVFLWMGEIVFFGMLYSIKVEDYQKLTGIVTHKNQISIYASSQERKLLYQNKKLFLEDQKKIYQIKEDRGISIKVGKKVYYEILIDIKLKEKYHDQEVVELMIQKRKKKLIELLKTIWEGG